MPKPQTPEESGENVKMQNKEGVVVAVDGPSGSGKSSVSREAARRLGAAYLDTGAMYRAATWQCVNDAVDLGKQDAVLKAVQEAKISVSTDPEQDQEVSVNGVDVTEAIREPSISERVSAVATNTGVREHLVQLQRAVIAENTRIVAEGRDITTVVAPDADVRVLLTASEEARMRRRGEQLGGAQDEKALAKQVLERDAKDSTVVNFTSAANGVHTLDSSELDFEQTVQALLEIVAGSLRDAARSSGDAGAGA